MNKKELAKEIFNHPMMKVLRESKGVDNKVLIRILAEEINEQYLLDEGPKNTLSNRLTKMLADTFKELGERTSDPETLTAAVNDTVIKFINLMKNDISQLFKTWDTWTDERKQRMIDAGQEYNPAIADRIKSALAKYAEDGQIDAGEAEEAAAVILEPIADELEADAEQQSPELSDGEATDVLDKFLGVVVQVLQAAPLQEQQEGELERQNIAMFFRQAKIPEDKYDAIINGLEGVELTPEQVDQALAAEGAVEKALEELKQRLEAPTEPEEAPAQPEEADAEATPENEDLEELPKAELQRKMLAQSIEPVDKFFDDTDGFLKQLLLSDQGKLLRDMIVGLGKIERGDLGEDLALTDIVVVPDEPDPQPETKPDEGETDSEPPEKAVVPEQMQEQEEPKVPANAKARRMVKNEVAAIRDLLKDVVAVAKRYEENATSTNIDSRFDGTKLKVVFDEKLEATQRQIARLVAIIGKVMEEAMADKAAEQLQEQDVKTRQEKVKLVQDTYRDLRRLYKNSFQVQAGEKFDFAKAQQAARNMINVVDDSGIVAFYPRITNFDATTGQVITLGQAYEEMTKLVKKLAKTTADIFLNIRDGEVEVNNMQRAILDLQDISSAIENYYGIKSMIRAKDVAKIDPEQAQTFIGDGNRKEVPAPPEQPPMRADGDGKEVPAPPEQPPMRADAEVTDEPMSRSDFFREYLKGDRYEELKNTGVSTKEIATLTDFLRRLKFNYEQSQISEKKGDGLRKIINFSKGQFSGDLFTKTLEEIGAVRNSVVQQRLGSVLDKATDFTIELIEDMLGITLGTSQFKNPLGDKRKSSVPKDLEFDTGEDIYSTGQMGTGTVDFSPDPSKRVPTADVEIIDEPDEETPSDTSPMSKALETAKEITKQIKGPFNERAFRESREGLEQIFLEDTMVNSAMVASMAALITAMSRDISKPLQEDLINKFLNANEFTWASKESIKAGLESLKKNVDEKSFRSIVNNLAQLYRLDNGSIMSKNSKKIAALFTEIAKLRASSSPLPGAIPGAPAPAPAQGGDSVPTRVVEPRKKTPARRLRGSRPPGGKRPKTPPRKRDARGRRMEEQLINKLIPIVESILKD